MELDEEWLHINETNNSNYKFPVLTWKAVTLYEFLDALAILTGFLANVIIIYTIARSVRMRTKTYYMIMNVAISDCLMLAMDTATFWDVWNYNIETHQLHNQRFLRCMFNFSREMMQLNTFVFLFVLASNTIMKSKRLQLKHILCGSYGVVSFMMMLNVIFCTNLMSVAVSYIGWFFFFMFFIVYIAIRDCNSCYKKLVKNDPLSETTLFRLDIARIYCYNWLLSSVFTIMYEQLWLIPFVYCRVNGYLTSVLILVYLIRFDRLFAEMFRNVIRCRRNVDANNDGTTIAYNEEHYLNDNNEEEAVNIRN